MVINPLNVANACRHHMGTKVGVAEVTVPMLMDEGAVFYITDSFGGMIKVIIGQYKAPVK